ncbi:MAG: hypothetical protein U0175_26920 [Caldilineaceae bacterium]
MRLTPSSLSKLPSINMICWRASPETQNEAIYVLVAATRYLAAHAPTVRAQDKPWHRPPSAPQREVV